MAQERDADREACERAQRERGLIPMARYRGRRYQIVDDVPRFSPDQIKATRDLLSCSQQIFARLIGSTKHTVGAWEQGHHTPPGPACRLMDEINRQPEYWRSRLSEVVTRKPKSGMPDSAEPDAEAAQ